MFVAHESTAGGAPLTQIVIAALISLTFLAPALLVVLAERRGQRNPAGRVADLLGVRFGAPRWLVLPSLTLFAALLSAGVGVYWDVPYHVDYGRDEGPLANPAHYLILFGLLGVFASGLLSMGLARDPLPRRTFRVWRDWRAPYGSVLVTAAGAFALLGFPLDDVWHRFFGQDVTEWGPTHVLMIGGAVISTLGVAVLAAEARQTQPPSPGRDASRESAPAQGARGRGIRTLEFTYALWWLLGIGAFLMEFDIGVPQFPMVSQVVIIAVMGAWPLVWARSAFGPGGALLAAVAFLAARGVLMLLASEVVDRSPHHFSLLLVQAVLIELLALVVDRRRRYLFGALAGLAVGTLGTLAEWQWSQLFLPLPWPAAELPLYVGYAVTAGVGAGLIGAWQLSRLDEIASPAPTERTAIRWRQHALLALGALLAFGMLAVSVPRTADESIHGELALTSAPGEHGPSAIVTVRLDDPKAADDAVWFHALSWQGGSMVRADMERVAPGVYRSTKPLPISDEWKTLVRLHTSTNYLVSLPVYLPADPEIPVGEVPAVSDVERPFSAELHLLQREARTDVPEALWHTGYAVVFAIYLALFGLIGALYARAAMPGAPPTAQPPATRREQEARA